MTTTQRHAVHVRRVRLELWRLALQRAAEDVELQGITISLMPCDQRPGGLGESRS